MTSGGRPVTNERGIFERLCLEAFQRGLLWAIRSDRFSTRQTQMQDNIKYMDRLLNYATGPWRDQDYDWCRSGGAAVIARVTTIAVGGDGTRL